VSLGELIGVGLTAVSARRHGERNPVAAARAAGTALCMAIGLGMLLGVGGVLALGPIFRVIGAQGEVAALARDFLLGARLPERARQAGWLTLRLAAVPTLCFAILFSPFRDPGECLQ
jgi:Na+-driven multidrug efflux pump